MKNISQTQICKPGGGGVGVFYNKLKMACARDLKALIVQTFACLINAFA